jgi:hypothetical protein
LTILVLIGSDFPAGKLAIQPEHAQLLRVRLRVLPSAAMVTTAEIQMIEEFSGAGRLL